MLIHVVYAHPSPSSFTAAVHRQVVERLKVRHEVDDLDLYAEGFQPTLSLAEREGYFSVDTNLAQVGRYADRLRAANALVLCFPTWWYGMPAILKGWFDRVWLPGVAFHNRIEGGAIRPGLTNLQKFSVVTTCNAPKWFMLVHMREPGKAVLMRGLKRLMAPTTQSYYLAHYDMLRSTPQSRQRFLSRIDRTFSAF